MKNFKMHRMWWLVAVVVGQLAVSGGLGADYRNPLEVKRLIESSLRRPQAPPGTIEYYYGEGVAHFDGLIPFDPVRMTQSYDAAKSHYKFTCQDGRIIKCEYLEGGGKSCGYFGVWYNSAGAPVLSAYIGADGLATWYEYPEYDATWKIQARYRFSAAFELNSYTEFTYEGTSTRIKDFRTDGTLDSETLYEDGGVFLIRNGEKKRVNSADRTQQIRGVVKYGLKPFYP